MEYNQEIYDDYMSRHDYKGAAAYVSKFRGKTRDEQNSLNSAVITLQKQGRIYNAVVNQANPDQRSALGFYTAIKNHTALPQDNPYTKKYVDAVNKLGNSDDKQATFVMIQFEPKVNRRYGQFGIDWLAEDTEYKDDSFTLFKSLNKLDDASLGKLGVSTGFNNGVPYMIIDKANPHYADIMMGLDNVDTNHTSDSYQPLDPNTVGQKRFYIAGIDAKGHRIQGGRDLMGRHEDTMNNSEQSILYSLTLGQFTTNDRLITKHFKNPDVNGSFNKDYYNEMTNTINQAKDITDDLYKNINKRASDTAQSSIVVGTLGARDGQLRGMLDTGQMSIEDYEKYHKDLKETYDRLLTQSNFNQYEMYANDPDEKDDRSLKTIDNDKKSELEQIIKANVGTGNLEYSAAMIGNKVGTMITIKPHVKKDENDLGGDGKERQFFIFNLFKDSAEESFNSNSKTRAAAELNNMQVYNYDYDIPGVGNISNINQMGGVLRTPDGKKYDITREEAQNHLNRAFIIEDGIRHANDSFYNEDGNLKTNNNDVINKVKQYANVATSELYPKTYSMLQQAKAQKINDKESQDFLTNKSFEISSYILSQIGFNNE